jgi:predicted NBD/HSP70 family sugar kinase
MISPRLPGTPHLLRVLNDRAALELLLSRGPLTRAQLGELTGLSKVTASQLVERLEEQGLVSRVGEQVGGRGPHARLYAVTPDIAYAIGADVSADRVVAACADITGAIVGRTERSTRDTDDPVGVVREAVVEAAGTIHGRRSTVRRIVLGIPGPVDSVSGDITPTVNLPYWHRGLPAALREHLRTPVVFVNAANLAAVAEAHAGAARGIDDFVLVRIDVNVGMAIVVGGRIHQGSTGVAGEIGYLPVPGMPVPRGVTRQTKGVFQRIVDADAVCALSREHGLCAASAADAVRAAIAAGAAGDPVLDEVARRLALGVASACVVLDPPLVVLAGEVGRAGGATLAERVRDEVRAITLVSPRVVTTGMAGEAVLQGALRTALDAAREEVFGVMG